MPKVDYMVAHKNQTVDQRDLYSAYVSVIAAISANKGMEAVMMFDHAVKNEHFIEFLKHLRYKNGTQSISLFMDNLRVHKSSEVNDALSTMNFKPIYNVPYQS